MSDHNDEEEVGVGREGGGGLRKEKERRRKTGRRRRREEVMAELMSHRNDRPK